MESEIIHWYLYFAEGVSLAYILLIASYYFGWHRMKKCMPTSMHNQLNICVLIALRNEENNIFPLLEGLNLQLYPKHLTQIILADDHSEDASSASIQEVIAKYPDLSIHYLQVNGVGKKAALAEALKIANGELIVVTDADCRHGKNWLNQMVACYQSGKYKLLLGPVLLEPTQTLFTKMQSLEFMSLIGTTAGAIAIGIPMMGNGANMAFSREAALEVGAFDQNSSFASGDDVFLLFEIVKKFGRKSVHFVYSEDAIVSTSPCPDFSSFVRQRMRWVSKSRGYRNLGIILPGMIVFVMNLMLVGIILLAFFFPYLLLIFLLFILLKHLIDFPILKATAGFMQKRKLLLLAFPMALIYPFYVVGIAIAGNLIVVSWKGRKK